MRSAEAREQLRKLGYRTFYRLPGRLRRRLVRLAVTKYTIGAVAIVRDPAGPGSGRILLLRQPPGVGWSLPAGLLQRNERPVDGCARELEEESGVRISPDDLAPAVPNAVVHSRGQWVDMVFEGTVSADDVTLRADGAEVLEAAWHQVDNLPPLTTSTAALLARYGVGPYADCPEVLR